MSIDAVYFDGETARDNAVTLRRVGSALEFLGDSTPLTSWSISGLHPIDPPSPGQPFRITHDEKPGARLIIKDDAFITDLVAQSHHLKGGYSWKHVGHVLGWTAAGFAGFAALGYVFLTILPDQVAKILPSDMKNTWGTQVVNSLVGTNKRCETDASKAAVSAMVGALAEGGSELPPVSVEVYDMDLVNAFAVPGGRIILTRGLINAASSPDEVTGVLAHELGHVYHLHSEAQMVRVSGFQILASVVTGGASTDLVTTAAGLAAILRYTRDAEREADDFARSVMTTASVDPMGLKTFFEKMMKLEGGSPKLDDSSPSALDRIGNVFSTHPGTEDRIKEIKPLPAGKSPIKIMNEDQWQALRKACG
jgi:beta-barrel assembly-enhancing protease